MSTQLSISPATVPMTFPVAFPSLAALRAAHSKLLEAHRAQGSPDPTTFWQEVENFLQRGRSAGALLDREEERATAQSLLDYWTATAYSIGRTMPDAALVDFDPTLAPELAEEQCPYVGLAAFHEGREKYFFGRERLVDALLAKVKESRLVAVVGPSGSGKSSLVLAGLVPILKSGVLGGDQKTTGSESWFYPARLVPGSDPLASLAHVIQPHADGAALGLAVATKFLFAAEGFRREADYLVQLLAAQNSPPLVLVVDQFEELFTLCTDDQVRSAFIDTLLALVNAPGPRHTVILTMRTDFESFVARLPAFLPHFEAALVRVTPLNAAELRAVIEKPAEMVGLKFEAGVVDALVQDVLGEPAALPLLQFTLLKLWELRERNRITWEAYKRSGGGRQALARSADRLYENLIPEDQVTLRRILLRLVRPGEGLEVTSNRVRQGVLYQSGEARDRVDRVLQKLVDADLVRLTTAKRPEDTQIEVAHEALVRNWPRLVGWLEDERGRIRERLRVTEAAEQWLKLGRDPGALLRGALLEDALRYTDLNELEQQYIKASQEALATVEREREAARQRELAQARALAAEQEQLAKSERQWAEFQAQTATKLRQRAWLLSVITAVTILLAAAGVWLAYRANQASDRAETASQEAFAQATSAEYARSEAVIQAAAANAARNDAEMQAAAAATAVEELRAKQAQLSHLAAALSYTGEQLDELERIIGNARETLLSPTQVAMGPVGGEPPATPTAPPVAPAAAPYPTPLPTPLASTSVAMRLTPPITGTTTAVAMMEPSAGLSVEEPIALEPVTPTVEIVATPELSTTVGNVDTTSQSPLSSAVAIVPDIEINFYAEASEKSAVLRTLRAPEVLTILQADAYWVQGQTSDGTVGWVEAYWLTYSGDISQLPRELRYRVVVEDKADSPAQTGSKLPFTYGTVIGVEGAESYSLLNNPKNPESQLTRAPVGADVTLLFTAEGSTTYGSSSLWYYVQMSDPEGKNVLWQGYLPAGVVGER